MFARWTLRVPNPGVAPSQLCGRMVATLAASQEDNGCPAASTLPSFLFQSFNGSEVGDGRLARNSLAREYARLHIKAVVIVHFFSGFRRFKDLHWCLEAEDWPGGLHVFVLSIDMCMQRSQADLATHRAIDFWIRCVRSGQVIAAGGGPPCESFSAARFLPDGPRPLRSHDEPYGLSALTAAEWRQTQVGSRLIRFGAEIVLELAAAGGCSFLEHPQFPVWALPYNPPSIWSWKELSIMRRFECIDVVSFDQCVLGTPMRKPTTLMLCRMRSLCRALQARGHMGRCNHEAGTHLALSGHTASGDFATALPRSTPSS